MKRQKRLMILSGVLLVCVAAVFIISRIDFEEEMVGEETVLVELDSSEITALSWNYDGEVSFHYTDEKWEYDNDTEMPVDQEKLSDIAEELSNITSDKKVNDVKNLSIYGLSDPKYTLTIETEEETYEIAIGDETFSDGEVYVSTGDDYVYLTDSELIDKISYSLLDLVQEEEVPEMNTITSVSIENESSMKIVYKENSGYCYSDVYTYYIKEDDSYRNLDNDLTKDTFDTLSNFTWSACVDYHAEETELSSYGLDEPSASVTIKYKDKEGEKKEFSYEVGTVEDEYYARLKDSDIIYKIDSEVYDAAVNASYKELQPDEVILLNWETVDSIDVEMDGSIYTIELSNTGDEEFTYTFDGKQIEFEDVLEELSSVTIEKKEKEESDSRKEELKLTFHRNTEDNKEVELTFYQYDGTYCIPVLNGETLNCVNREDVVSLKEAINSVVLGESAKEE